MLHDNTVQEGGFDCINICWDYERINNYGAKKKLKKRCLYSVSGQCYHNDNGSGGGAAAATAAELIMMVIIIWRQFCIEWLYTYVLDCVTWQFRYLFLLFRFKTSLLVLVVFCLFFSPPLQKRGQSGIGWYVSR